MSILETQAIETSLLEDIKYRRDEKHHLGLFLFYKVIHQLIAIPIPEYLMTPARMTRQFHQRRFVGLGSSSEQRKHSFFVRTITKWNELPPSLLDIDDYEAFKTHLIAHRYPRRVKFDEMEMWLVVIFSFLSYSCNGSLVDQSTQSFVIAEYKGTDITDIKMEVDVMKGNYHALLLRVINNEHEIASLKSQTQQLEHELENTRRTFTCELQGLRDTTIQYEQELNEAINSWNTFNETIQDLSHSVSVLDNKYSLLEISGRHSNESGVYIYFLVGKSK
ncbi:unnamed protein product [Mytilus coruscus]|uniref:Uncharacterized protein n=1 Tax=Mytilus coruscus TaxID=42192 RepID=A0A6J8DVG8_MYTCO|nr:unnamed protein product [Mytilus coruscus]